MLVLKFKDETFTIKVDGKPILLAAGSDIEIVFDQIDRLEWLRAEYERVRKGGE